MPSIRQIIAYLEEWAPLNYQESYDNAGLIVGDYSENVDGILVTLDAIEQVVEEAKELSCNLIIAHHPIVFRGLKSLTGKNYVERTVIKAIKNDIAIYASHTNLDNAYKGVNFKIAEILGLEKVRILDQKSYQLMKLTTFVPLENTSLVLEALGKAGAGQLGEYKNCSFRVTGKGTFQPTEKAQPHIGEANRLEEVEENRIEVIFPLHLKAAVLQALYQNHPYEEVAYYLHLLENQHPEIGSGAMGLLPEPMEEKAFLTMLKEKLRVSCIRHTALLHKSIQKVALCGGAGSFLLTKAIAQQADAFVSADFKYHEFFDADHQILVADVGHYESEQFTKELISDYLKNKFNHIPIYISKNNTNPVEYF